jgi:hypothetical protein
MAESTYDPDWATKITTEQFLENARRLKANGTLHPKNEKVLDDHEPGWYGLWSNATPGSVDDIEHRNAITSALVPDTVLVFNHDSDNDMTLERRDNSDSEVISLTGTDDQMRSTVLSALARLGIQPKVR